MDLPFIISSEILTFSNASKEKVEELVNEKLAQDLIIEKNDLNFNSYLGTFDGYIMFLRRTFKEGIEG